MSRFHGSLCSFDCSKHFITCAAAVLWEVGILFLVSVCVSVLYAKYLAKTLCVVRCRNKKCSENGPKWCYSVRNSASTRSVTISSYDGSWKWHLTLIFDLWPYDLFCILMQHPLRERYWLTVHWHCLKGRIISGLTYLLCKCCEGESISTGFPCFLESFGFFLKFPAPGKSRKMSSVLEFTCGLINHHFCVQNTMYK